MRIMSSPVIAVVIVALAMVTGAQMRARDIHMEYITYSNVPVPAPGSTKIDPAKVKFLSRRPCSVEYEPRTPIGTVKASVMGIVAKELDLSEDATAQQLLQMGIEFGREQCPPVGEFGERDKEGRLRKRAVTVQLFFGDPTKFSSADIQKFFDGRREGNGYTAYDTLLDQVYGYWRDDKPELIVGYRNYPKALKLSLAYDAQETKKREAADAQRRQAEETMRAQIAARRAAFVKANRVRRFVSGSQLATNPFVYEGQIVAMSCTFVRMNSATQAVFSNGNYSFVVSGVPTTRFTQSGSLLVLAGRVLADGSLAFVGSVFCQQAGCSDYVQ